MKRRYVLIAAALLIVLVIFAGRDRFAGSAGDADSLVGADGRPGDGASRRMGWGGLFGARDEAPVASLKPGLYGVALAPMTGALPRPTQVPIVDGLNEILWDISSDASVVEGRVVDAATGVALENVHVTPAYTTGARWNRQLYPLSLTDPDGRFTFEVADLSLPLFFFHEGYESQVFAAGESSQVSLAPGQSLRSMKVK